MPSNILIRNCTSCAWQLRRDLQKRRLYWGKGEGVFNPPKRCTPFPQATNPSTACALASTLCMAEDGSNAFGKDSGEGSGMVVLTTREREHNKGSPFQHLQVA